MLSPKMCVVNLERDPRPHLLPRPILERFERLASVFSKPLRSRMLHFRAHETQSIDYACILNCRCVSKSSSKVLARGLI